MLPLVSIISVSLKSRNGVNLSKMGYPYGQSNYLLNYDLCVCEDDICANIKQFLKGVISEDY